MLDGVVDILAQLQKMEEHGTRLRSNELDENIRRVYELRNQLERYMTRNVVAKAFRQSKTRMYLSDLETTLESLATLHEGLCQHKTEENLRRLNVLAQSLCEAMEEMAVDHDFELSVSSPSVAPSHSFKATPRAPKVKSIMMSTFSRFNAAAFASVSQPEHADLNLNVSTNQGGDSDQQITMQYVEMLESGGDNEKSEALWSLNQISKHTSCTMNASRVAAALVAAMKHSSTLHRLLATRVLRNLAKIALVDEDVLCAQAIPALLDSLDAHNDRVILEATSTLLVLAQSCTLQTEIVAAGGLEKLVTIAKQPRWGRVTATVLAALCALSAPISVLDNVEHPEHKFGLQSHLAGLEDRRKLMQKRKPEAPPKQN
ncbi:hypothetical protein Poli38472_004773 [Pythium oligandrum]|uniref:Uncharacterized protein n=1 Tax=Pythium oligandrum TaxID=41045 RepID=A0A8K1CAX8_PYTOL|nr:hypothetical protein Poli38472_004773 [Pythium oligandrum]|eukprot:TMW59704.1 hypothetical protein Poli38472_004773 [Pythium oligandrum]